MHRLRYVSVFSGIEAASVAWIPLGFEPVAFSEIEPFPCAVLDYWFPEVPNLGDITRVDWSEVGRTAGPVDLVAGGSPCQSFSVAGKREGLDGESRLMWEYVRCVSGLRPRWLVWENVPGALSSGGGDDFRCLLEALDALGYGLAWRVLDARFFGVAQRRERVWLVGHLGGRPPVGVLFEPDGLRWDFEAGREKWQGLAAAAGIDLGVAGFKYHQGEGSCSLGLEGGQSPTLVADYHQPAIFAQNTRDEVRVMPYAGALAADAGAKQQSYVMLTSNTGANGSNVSADDLAYTLGSDNGNAVMCMADGTSGAAVGVEQAGTLHVGGMPPSVAVDARNMRAEPELSGTLQAKPNGGQSLNYVNPVMLKLRHTGSPNVGGGEGAMWQENQSYTLATGQDQTLFASSPTGYAVRRLTPVECERLQGFEDGWTDIPYRGKPHPPDTPRYKALGNSWAVPCARWIGRRIQMYEEGEIA